MVAGEQPAASIAPGFSDLGRGRIMAYATDSGPNAAGPEGVPKPVEAIDVSTDSTKPPAAKLPTSAQSACRALS